MSGHVDAHWVFRNYLWHQGGQGVTKGAALQHWSSLSPHPSRRLQLPGAHLAITKASFPLGPKLHVSGFTEPQHTEASRYYLKIVPFAAIVPSIQRTCLPLCTARPETDKWPVSIMNPPVTEQPEERDKVQHICIKIKMDGICSAAI